MLDQEDNLDQLKQELSLLQNGPVIVFKWKNQEKWPVEYVSRNIFNTLGYTEKEFTQGAIIYADIIHPDDLARVSEEVQQNSQAQKVSFDHEPYRLVHRNGQSIWVSDHTIVLRDKAGQITHYLGYLVDITLQKKTEESLRQSEERLNLVFQGASLGTWDCNLQTSHATINDRWAEILGYRVAELEPSVRTWRELIHPEDKSRVIATIKDHIEGRTPAYQSEHRLKTKSGDWRWVMESGNIVARDSQGTPLRTAGILKDIDSRKQAEIELQRSHKRFKTVLDSIDACIYVADMETYEILFMNKNMIEAFGKDFTGDICWRAFRNEGQPCENCTNNLLLNAEQQPTGVQTWQAINPITGRNYIHYDRAIRWTEDRMARIQIATDATEHKNMEMQLRQKYKMEAVGLMAGGIAHNFNNSLAIILGNIKLAQMKLTKENPAAPYLENAYMSVHRSGHLVKQILSYSRKGEYLQTPILFTQIIDETLGLLRSTIPTSVDIQRNISAQYKDLTINADPSQIQEILINLCTNAVYAMDEKGTLAVSLESAELTKNDIPVQYEREPGAYALLRVSDTGSGMAAEVLDKIFDPFFTTKAVNQGTGMGLSTVQGIVEQHAGLIKVKSIPGEGSSFEIYFPIIASKKIKSTQTNKNLPRGTERILFLDDDDLLANVGSQMLSEFGYIVTTATDSVKALADFKKNPDQYDLVITDQTMPTLSGKELLKEMLKIRPNLPTMLCTGYSNKINKEEAKQLGVKAFFFKPLDLPDLIKSTRKALDGVEID